MGLEPTVDEATFIEERGPARVVYVMPARGLRWEVVGTCPATSRGPCMGAGPDGDPGPPEGRRDFPVFPWSKCSLCLAGDDPPLHVRVLP